MTGFEPGSSSIRRDYDVNSYTTTTQVVVYVYYSI